MKTNISFECEYCGAGYAVRNGKTIWNRLQIDKRPDGRPMLIAACEACGKVLELFDSSMLPPSVIHNALVRCGTSGSPKFMETPPGYPNRHLNDIESDRYWEQVTAQSRAREEEMNRRPGSILSLTKIAEYQKSNSVTLYTYKAVRVYADGSEWLKGTWQIKRRDWKATRGYVTSQRSSSTFTIVGDTYCKVNSCDIEYGLAEALRKLKKYIKSRNDDGIHKWVDKLEGVA